MIDQARIKELEDDFGAEDLYDLIEAFLAEAEEAVGGLSAFVSDAADTGRQDQFHFLKGCALNIGATQFADLCEQFEQESAGFSDADYRQVRAEFQAVRSFFNGEELRRSA